MFGAQTDITDRKHTELKLEGKNYQLDHALKLASSSSRAKGAFLATISHEIRTPLNGILGLSTILSESSVTDEQRDLLRSMRECSSGLLAIINDILDFSKIESGKFKLDHAPFDLHECLTTTAHALHAGARMKGVALSSYIAPGTPRWVYGDVARVKQVLNNLIGNAIKFTSAGSIEVQLEGNEYVARVVRGASITCSVTGREFLVGSPPHFSCAHILFWLLSDCPSGEGTKKVDSSSTRRVEGTGLGLAICKQLVEMMDPQAGRIWVESELGKGSTFSFFMQADLASPIEPRGSEEESGGSGSMQFSDVAVLLAEDNSINRKVAVRLLQKLKCTPDVVQNGMDALVLMRKRKYDLVLMVPPTPPRPYPSRRTEVKDMDQSSKSQ
ncbi:histidine kinase-like ATPase [Blyttiomyces helicus]|uniref:histidine kinase n=1 Tax=Blyttiomyces helicus TaxID=388810 RepID=A0A4P9W6N2_9FUNG|nr:histidine kinase-like ATPase [Blyttiomyces helicus]|eukprot:RKO88121.1 histidine kinase-like ATPase [Blyttiomyces helicus]